MNEIVQTLEDPHMIAAMENNLEEEHCNTCDVDLLFGNWFHHMVGAEVGMAFLVVRECGFVGGEREE